MVVQRTTVAIFHESIGKGSTSEGEMAYNQEYNQKLETQTPRMGTWLHARGKSCS